LSILNGGIVLILVAATFSGFYYRAFIAAIYCVLATGGFFLAVLLGPPLVNMVAGSADVPEYIFRLAIHTGLFLLVVAGGAAAARRFWVRKDVPMMAPLDRILGVVLGFGGGVMTASCVAFICFAHPTLDAAFYPPEDELPGLLNWTGPDPVLHLPYRSMQVVSGFDRITGGEGLHPGEQGARWAAGPIGQNFHRAFVQAEELKETDPIGALKAWEAFQSDPWQGVQAPSGGRSPAVAAPWVFRASRRRAELKPHLEEKDTEFFSYLRSECIVPGNLDAVERAVVDCEQIFPEHPNTQGVLALGEIIGTVREIRALAQDQPKAAGSKLRALLSNCPGGSPAMRLVTREMAALSGSSVAIGPGGRAKTPKKEASSLVDRFQFERALQILRGLELQERSEEERRKLGDLIGDIEAMRGLHKTAVAAINTAESKKSLPGELELGTGTILSATLSNVAIDANGSMKGPSWAQLGPTKARAIYLLYLGPKANGIKVFDRYFRIEE